MGNVVNLPNITPEAIAELEKNQPSQGNSKFDTKNYLDTRLKKGETEKSVTIRLLPMDLKTGNPFVKIHVHNVKVPKEMVAAGQKPYKTYLCLAKNEGINHEQFGTKCPFCELNKSAYDKSEEQTDPTMKKTYQDISLANKSNEAYIVRCIERGHEEDGVKFWKFNERFDKKDPYHTIINLYNKRKEEAEKKGKTENILDIYEGYDLTITFNDGNPVPPPTIIDAKEPSPLSEDEELMKKWIYDEKKWTDVFTPKSYEFLQLVSEMRVPWFDKSKNMWVDKEEYEKEHGKQVQKKKDEEAAIDAEIKEAESRIASESKSEPVQESTLVVEENGGDDLPF